jgi:hypothetical protein
MAEPFISSDPGAWMRPYYAEIAEQRGFEFLSLSLRFALLVARVAQDHPAEAVKVRKRGHSPAAQEAILGWLADVTAQKPAVREIELWRVQKGPRELRCVTVYLPAGIDLRLFEGEDFRRTELLRDAPSVRFRASEWREMLGRRGWSEETTE